MEVFFMWTRADLKQRGKHAFKANYWKCVLVAFIILLISGSGSNSSNSNNNSNTTDPNYDYEMEINGNYIEYNFDDPEFSINEFSQTIVDELPFHAGILMGGFTIIVLVIFIGALLLGFFVFNPLLVGGKRFFVENAAAPAQPGSLLYGFQNGNYKNIVKTMFFKDLYTALWTLLLIVPGIIKHYEYYMVPYLLADSPNMTKEDAFRISKELMDGNKLDVFVLNLSFIGWHILSTFTLGILGVFYVNPYEYATDAELFLTLKQQYLHKPSGCEM